MVRELLRKWFGLSEPHCETCDVLRSSLEKSDMERRELLQRLLERDKPEPLSEQKEIPIPIMPKFVPWSVRQQMMEAEDRKLAQINREKAREIADLEKELDVR